MSTLGTERATIAASLVGDYERHTHVPDRLIPPAAIITPADPYLERRADNPFGQLTAAWEVWIVRSAGANDLVTSELDDEIERQVAALTAEGFAVERVSEPFMYAVQGANFLTSIIYVTTGVTFTN